MPIVDLNAVIVNCHLDLLDYLSTGGFNAEDLSCLHDVVRYSGPEVDAWCAHNLGQSVSLDSQRILLLFHILANNSSLYLRITLDDNMWQSALHLLHSEVQLLTTGLTWLDMDLVLRLN